MQRVFKSPSWARMKKYKRKAQQYQKSVITIARVMSLKRAVRSFRSGEYRARLKLRHDPSSYPGERLILFASHPPLCSSSLRAPVLSWSCITVRMSRIEVQRSNSRNKIIAITIAISSRTTEPWKERRGAESGRGKTRNAAERRRKNDRRRELNYKVR